MEVYACYLKNEKELMESSSGGVFTALTNSILNEQGVVIACSYNYDNHILEFDKATSIEERNRMRGSKYIQAHTKKLYEILKEELNKDERAPIFVIGTPCQMAGVKKIYEDFNDSNKREMIICDLICHGVSSSTMWKEYVDKIEREDGKISLLTFKDKERGWIRPTAKVYFKNGKEALIEDYAKLYRSNDFMRESCYSCKFANTKRVGDITIGDFWNYEKLDEDFVNMKGISLVLINSARGKKLFEKSKEQLKYCQSSIEDAMQWNLKSPTVKTKMYNKIHKDYRKKGLEFIIEKYVHFGPGGRIIRKIRRKYLKLRYK